MQFLRMASWYTEATAWPASSDTYRSFGMGQSVGVAHGRWETFASSSAALRYCAECKPNIPTRTIEDLLRLVGEGDQDAIAAVTRQAEAIGRGLRLVSAALAPELILIAGDIVVTWDLVGAVIEKAFHTSALAGLAPRLMPTHQGEVARLRGAAIVVFQRRSSHREAVEPRRVSRPRKKPRQTTRYQAARA